MKSSDFVKINMFNDPVNLGMNANLNNTCAIIYVHKSSTEDPASTTDTIWQETLSNDYQGKTLIDIATNTFITNGGIKLVYKRFYFGSEETDADIVTAILQGIRGEEGQEKLNKAIINIQVIEEGLNLLIAPLAQGLLSNDNIEDRKILFVTSNSIPTGLSSIDNVFYQYYDTKAVTGGVLINNYESASAMAYLSRIDYYNELIKDYEFTDWLGSLNNLNIVNELPTIADGTAVNVYANMIGRYFIVGGLLTSNIRLITYYFEIIITQKLTDSLMLLLLSKISFNNNTYAAIYNRITILLDMFTANGLLDSSFVSPLERFIYRDNVKNVLLEKDEILINGYKANILPATQEELRTREYKGIYIYIAIDNQIRKIEVNGLAIGGV